ncbi:MAG: lipoprotein [Pseudomonas sp.]|nr:lipoprotein [Pseudomonas sp.]
MRQPLLITALVTLAGCVNPPLPPKDAQQAWIDMFTYTGNVVMADKLDGKSWPDGRYFQVQPGKHELQIRFDYETNGILGSAFLDGWSRTCYIVVDYDNFAPGQHYRLEARNAGVTISGRLYDEQRKMVAEDREVTCI